MRFSNKFKHVERVNDVGFGMFCKVSEYNDHLISKRHGKRVTITTEDVKLYSRRNPSLNELLCQKLTSK